MTPGMVTVTSSGTSAPENFPFNVVVVETDVQATAAMAVNAPMITFFISYKIFMLQRRVRLCASRRINS